VTCSSDRLHNVCMRTSKTPPKPAPTMKRANYFLPQSVINGLAQVAEHQTAKQGSRVTAAEVLRKAASAYLKRFGIST
jgi:hypothetical protein